MTKKNFFHTKVSWKVCNLNKTLSWNVTKRGLFFNIVPLVIHTFLSSLLQYFPLVKKIINGWYDVVIWTFQHTLICLYLNINSLLFFSNFWHFPLFIYNVCMYIYIYIYICVYVCNFCQWKKNYFLSCQNFRYGFNSDGHKVVYNRLASRKEKQKIKGKK